MNQKTDCPRCEGPLPEKPALSWWDQQSYICATCAAEEALYDMTWGGVPNFDFVIVGGNKYQKTDNNSDALRVTGRELA